MKFGVREICNAVLKSKSDNNKIGSQVFSKGQPVLYLDTAKTSALEGEAETVYATGGSGNNNLIAWEGGKKLTFTIEDALMSPLGLAILTGAGIVEASTEAALSVHTTSMVEAEAGTGEGAAALIKIAGAKIDDQADIYVMPLDDAGEINGPSMKGTATTVGSDATVTATGLVVGSVYFVDYYIKETEETTVQFEITPDKFGGYYYLEASTLFRREADGVDLPAEIVIPKVKVQSKFTFTMASTGDPSTFTFTMDAFPDFTKFDKTKKVLCAIQVIGN